MVVFDLLLVLPALLVQWIDPCFAVSMCGEPVAEWRRSLVAIVLIVAGIAAGPGLLIMLTWASFGTLVKWRDRRRAPRATSPEGAAG